MAHARQAIREAVATLLTGLTTTGANVFQSRVFPYSDAVLPALNVVTENEEVEEHITGTTTLRRLVVRVEGRAKATSNIDDTLDTIAAEVEAAFYGDPQLSGSAKFGGLVSTAIELDGESEKPVGKVSLFFDIVYHVDGTAPTVII